VLLEEHLDNKLSERVAKMFTDGNIAFKMISLVRGLLRNQILLLCLRKRWNVQYGSHPKRDPMAVPFEANVIPSEQAEFGHPDAAFFSPAWLSIILVLAQSSFMKLSATFWHHMIMLASTIGGPAVAIRFRRLCITGTLSTPITMSGWMSSSSIFKETESCLTTT
jgi:hypothetical protein